MHIPAGRAGMHTTASKRSMGCRGHKLALFALLYYSCVFLVKSSMFACTWTHRPSFAGLSFKTCLALAQTFGYAVGKVPSMAFSPKLPRAHLRSALMAVLGAAASCVTLSCITTAAVSLLLVGLACVCLAPTWSLLQRFLEGRRDTEGIVAVVSFSYIGAAGLCKGAAVDLVALGFSEERAVATCAVAGALVGVAAAHGVAAQPPPDAADIAKRGRRAQMTDYRAECGQLCHRFGVGIGVSVVAYTCLGALRAYRDYFQLELFAAVGLVGRSSLFALSEFIVSLVVLAATAAFGLVEDDRRAISVILRVAACGGLGLSLLTWAHQAGALGGLQWIIAMGACAFLACAPHPTHDPLGRLCLPARAPEPTRPIQ